MLAALRCESGRPITLRKPGAAAAGTAAKPSPLYEAVPHRDSRRSWPQPTATNRLALFCRLADALRRLELDVAGDQDWITWFAASFLRYPVAICRRDPGFAGYFPRPRPTLAVESRGCLILAGTGVLMFSLNYALLFGRNCTFHPDLPRSFRHRFRFSGWCSRIGCCRMSLCAGNV